MGQHDACAGDVCHSLLPSRYKQWPVACAAGHDLLHHGQVGGECCCLTQWPMWPVHEKYNLKEQTMPTDNDHRALHLDPQILDFLKALEAQGGPALSTLEAASARTVLLSLQRSVTVAPLPADNEERTIRCGPTGEIVLRLVRPRGASGALPAVMYFHGGRWMLGDAETHDRLVREIAI